VIASEPHMPQAVSNLLCHGLASSLTVATSAPGKSSSAVSPPSLALKSLRSYSIASLRTSNYTAEPMSVEADEQLLCAVVMRSSNHQAFFSASPSPDSPPNSLLLYRRSLV